MNQLAKDKFNKLEAASERFVYDVEFLSFDGKRGSRSSTQLLLRLAFPIDLMPEVSLGLVKLRSLL